MVFRAGTRWESEIPKIKELGLAGENLTSLALMYGVSRQRMKQVTDKYIPGWADNYGFAAKRVHDLEARFKKWGHKKDTELYKSQRAKWRSKKANAKRCGFTFDVDFWDLEWPTHCPILGMELDYFQPFRGENSPSFDQHDPAKGYVKGNVYIISWRANRIKNNGTAEEHEHIARYLREHVHGY